MNRYTVYQFKLSHEAADEVNRVGWDEAMKLFPEVEINLRVSFMGGSTNFSEWMSEYYNPVCTIDAESLNQVFHIGNMGPEESIERLAPMHSVSVGDVIFDSQNNTYTMVDGDGFSELTNFAVKEVA